MVRLHTDEGSEFVDGVVRVMLVGEAILDKELFSLDAQNGMEEAADDVSGAYLDPSLVKAGRILELNYFKDMKVYDRVPRSHLAATGGKIVGTMWIDTHKGDTDNPNVRCRLVGKRAPTTRSSPALRRGRR